MPLRKPVDWSEWLTVTLPCPNGDLVFPCAVIDVAPHLPDYRFVIHKSTTFLEEWTVSECSTGFAIATRCDMDEAIDLAAYRLAAKTQEQVAAAINKTPERVAERDKRLPSA